MPYHGLSSFIKDLEKQHQLDRIKVFADPLLEITEIADRMIKAGGKALLFENTGTPFPLLINAFGSDKRMAMALSKKDLCEAVAEIEEILSGLPGPGAGLLKKLAALPLLARISQFLPARSRFRGTCQQVVHKNPDISIFPILKCWPHDGGRFITLPVVHTIHPVTRNPNAGMYRIQVIDSKTTAMHWQRHKTGAAHYREWKKTGNRMPVSVTLGGDPVYTYAATAPLPENLDEYILAGFLRKKKVKLVKCLTNDLYVPADADIVIEGYVDPTEDLSLEGPFGDHTGFYSLADYYPRFHVTCITHSVKAIYPATIVGIPPMEDVWLARTTERIFLPPLRFIMIPEIEDMHLPAEGVAHNLLIVSIKKTYPGQGKKVISSLLGAGQMMFAKYLVVVSSGVDIRNFRQLVRQVLASTDFSRDLLFMTGPLDVLDHASDAFSIGGKLGIDATEKMPEEGTAAISYGQTAGDSDSAVREIKQSGFISGVHVLSELEMIITAVDQESDMDAVEKLRNILSRTAPRARIVLAVEKNVDPEDLPAVAWQVLGNSDPQRDAAIIAGKVLFIDGTVKAFRRGGFSRKWPNVVCSSLQTIEAIDGKWSSLGLGRFIESPSRRNLRLVWPGNEEVVSGKG